MMVLKVSGSELATGAMLPANDDPTAIGLPRLGRQIGALDASPSWGVEGATMTVAAVEAWASTAQPGDELVYAIGHLPAWSKGPGRVRELDADGYVFAFHDRSHTPKHYVARRLGKTWPKAKAQPKAKEVSPAVAPAPAPQAAPVAFASRPPRVARPVPDCRPYLAPLLRELTKLAAKGKPCPTDRELAKRIGLGETVEARNRVPGLLQTLIHEGKIRRRPCPRPVFRIITIVASGDRTGSEA
jgi:hypothetical protein